MNGIMSIKSASETATADYNIGKLLDMPGGLEKIALEKLPDFIRETRDYEAFGRQILVTHPVTTEDIQIIDNQPYVFYPKDMNSHAAFYGRDGEAPSYQIEGTGVNVGIVTIMSDDQKINMLELMIQRYNYVERTRNLSGQAIAQLEDKKIIDLTESILLGKSTDPKNPDNTSQIVTSTDSSLLKTHLTQLKKRLSQWDVPLGNFVMNQIRIDDILDWATSEIDQLTQREILESGAKYSIWGDIKLIPSRIIDQNTVYAYSLPEYVGRMPILKDLSVQLTQEENKLEKGLFLFEFLGFYMASQKAVAKLILNYVNGNNLVTLNSKVELEGTTARDASTPVNGFGSREGL